MEIQTFLLKKNAFENVGEMSAILSQPQCVNWLDYGCIMYKLQYGMVLYILYLISFYLILSITEMNKVEYIMMAWLKTAVTLVR